VLGPVRFAEGDLYLPTVPRAAFHVVVVIGEKFMWLSRLSHRVHRCTYIPTVSSYHAALNNEKITLRAYRLVRY
jgi:hypothetical protein